MALRRKQRTIVALALMGWGLFGLLATAGGGLQHAPAWVWLVVMGLGVAVRVAGDHAAARQRLARRTEKRLASASASLGEFQLRTGQRLAALTQEMEAMNTALRERMDAIATPESMQKLVDNVNRIATDLGPVVEAFKSGRLASQVKSAMGRQS